MSIISRAFNVIKTEGVSGVSHRVRIRQMLIVIKLSKILGRTYVKSAYGLKFAANYADATFVFYICAVYGFFYWQRLLAIDYKFVFLDIGANQGLYAIGVTRNPNLVSSYAFEPVSDTFAYLSKNIRINNAEDKCIAINKAIADRAGVAEIAIKAGHSGMATLADANELSINDADTDEIELIDAVCLNGIIQTDTTPIIVKIDVEGFEPVVLEELFKTEFAPRIQEIFLEVDENWVDVNSIESALRNFGFDNFTRVGNSDAHYDLLAERYP